MSYAKRRFYELTGVCIDETMTVQTASQMLKKNENSNKVDVIYDLNNIQAPCMAQTKGSTSAQHVIVVEYVERDSQGKPTKVYFTESNNSSQRDGELQCMSFADFKTKKKLLGYIVPK